jgi:HEAT repeat protein
LATPEDILDRVNADNFAVLYRCRWRPEVAEEIAPQLAELLTHFDSRIVAESLRALHRIGPAAFSSKSAVHLSLSHSDLIVRKLAVSALAAICLERPNDAIPGIVIAADDSELLETCLMALINFGSAAASAAPLFCRCYKNRNSKIRRLAVRALRACGATDDESVEVMLTALHDSSNDVRRAAARK